MAERVALGAGLDPPGAEAAAVTADATEAAGAAALSRRRAHRPSASERARAHLARVPAQRAADWAQGGVGRESGLPRLRDRGGSADRPGIRSAGDQTGRPSRPGPDGQRAAPASVVAMAKTPSPMKAAFMPSVAPAQPAAR